MVLENAQADTNMKYTTNQVEGALEDIISIVEEYIEYREDDTDLYRVALYLLLKSDMSYLRRPQKSLIEQSELFE